MPKCGAQPVFYTYPAWTFPGKRRAEAAPPGPGVGGIGANPNQFGTTGFVYGPRRPGRKQAEPFGDGLLTQQVPLSKGPAHSFGRRHVANPDATPGPDAFDTRRGWTAPSSSWGPPPRVARPASAPRMRPLEQVEPVKPKGPSFGLPWRKTADLTPGPLDYQCGCAGSCCKACDSYNGVTLKGRRPLFYGKVTTLTPGPAAYHTECSTIGVAAKPCSSSDPASSGARTRRH